MLLFKTVIAGDSWGRIAVPVIEILGPETSDGLERRDLANCEEGAVAASGVLQVLSNR